MFRRHVLVATFAAIVALPPTVEAAPKADDDPARIPRVRPNEPAIAALIEQGVLQSKTFKSLVAAIDRTDGIVYVHEGRCWHGVRACLMLSITVAGDYRILHILVKRDGEERRLIASIGHELRHALEVLSEPAIRSNADAYHFFARTAPTDKEIFETRAAVLAGMDVYAELGSHK